MGAMRELRTMNHLNEPEIVTARQRVVSTARALGEKQGLFLEGVQQLDGLRFKVSNQDHDPDFTLFTVISSKADHLPPSQARHLC